MDLFNVPSPNFETNTIPVNYGILHYTGNTLPHSLAIFRDRKSKVTSHFTISRRGITYDHGYCFDGDILQGAHAGKSMYKQDNTLLEKFNAYSLGIELENLNGNVFDYTDAQYESLALLIRHLAVRYPALGSPERILGHEHIAGFRGKADPGLTFDWQRFYAMTYESNRGPDRTAVCTPELALALEMKICNAEETDLRHCSFWTNLGQELESSVQYAYGKSTLQ